MIETNKPALTSVIKDSWKKSYNLLDPHFIDFFFSEIYQPSCGFVNFVEKEPAATIVRKKTDVMYNDAVISTSVIMTPCVFPSFRKDVGVLNALVNTVLDKCMHAELFTLVSIDCWELFRSYGFEPFYYQDEYTVTRNDVQRITNYGCAYEPKPLDMLKVYSAFIRRFNGFSTRNLEDFVQLKKAVNSHKGKIVAYFDAKDQIQGYATIYLENRQTAIITECVYLNSLTLSKLLNAALQERSIVKVRVSAAENIARIYPGIQKKSYPSYCLKINHPELLTRQFSQKIQTVKDFRAISRNPLSFKESYFL